MFVGLFGGEIYYVQKLQCWVYDVFQVKTHVRKKFSLIQEILPLKSHVMWFMGISFTWLQVKLISSGNLTSIWPLFLLKKWNWFCVAKCWFSKVHLRNSHGKKKQTFRAFGILLFCQMLFIWSQAPKIFKVCSNYVRYIHFNSSELEFFFRLLAGTPSSFRIDSTYRR